MLIGHDFAFPVKNPTKLHDVRVAQLDQLLGRLFTASATTTVDHNELILIGQFGDLDCAEGFVWHVDGVRKSHLRLNEEGQHPN